MTTLVTGGTGFIGAAVVRALLARGEGVRVLVRAGSRTDNLDGLDLERVRGDLNDPASLRAACQGIRRLYHLAADYRLWVPDPERLLRTNVAGTKSLLAAAAAAGVERVVYTSSVATLGLRADGGAADESLSARPAELIGPYKKSKHAAEQRVLEMVEQRGLPVVVVNPSTPVGPRDLRPTPTGRLVLEAARGRIPAYVDTGLNLVHVDDVALGHLLAMDGGRVGERYILGGDNLSLGHILEIIARLVGRRPPRVRLPAQLVLPFAWLGELWVRSAGGSEPLMTVDGVRMSQKRMYFTSAKAEAELGYRHRPASEALADAVRCFRTRGLVA
ncbi:MAG: NAD-dependent epimerase/dehydratase family protein [Geminicoccaceae bacterium]|nr:NAD-dependent epimerase/dehydratase family protein [Geminicoccaceae bacterium]